MKKNLIQEEKKSSRDAGQVRNAMKKQIGIQMIGDTDALIL